MGKRIASWSMVTLFTLALAFAGCGKKEEQPAQTPPAQAPAAPAAPEGGAPGAPGAMAPAPAGGEAAPAAPAAPMESKSAEKKAEGKKAK